MQAQPTTHVEHGEVHIAVFELLHQETDSRNHLSRLKQRGREERRCECAVRTSAEQQQQPPLASSVAVELTFLFSGLRWLMIVDFPELSSPTTRHLLCLLLLPPIASWRAGAEEEWSGVWSSD